MATLDLGAANGLIRQIFLPKVVDTVTTSNPLYLMMRERGERFEGGESISVPIMYGDVVEGEGGSFGDTSDNLPSEAGEDAAAVNFTWASYSQPIRITLRELAKFSSSEAAAIRLLRIRTQSAAMKMARRLGTHLYAAVGHNTDDILSLPDVFSTTNTYGLIDRSATGNSFFHAKTVDASTDGTTATAITLRKVSDAIEEATEGQIRPGIGLTSKALYQRIKDLQMDKMRYSDKAVLDYGGFTGVVVDGVPIFPDSHADTGGSDGTNTRYILRFLNPEFIHWMSHDEFNFTMRDLMPMSAISQVYIAHILWFGQFYCDNPRYQSQLINCKSTA